MKIIGLFSGNKTTIGPKLSPTGIYKSPVQRVSVNTLGIVGDTQADIRVHGGPEKALHQFSLTSYQKIIQHYPLLHKKAWPGAIGENISAPQMNENSVCIGDVFAVGSTVLQVSSPRIPCWKIDAKFKQPGLNSFIRHHQLSGWYYRVLQSGGIQLGDEFKLIERSNPQLSIRIFLKFCQSDTKNSQFLDLISQARHLDPEWRHKLLDN